MCIEYEILSYKEEESWRNQISLVGLRYQNTNGSGTKIEFYK